ncbi:MAG: ABC transporter permease [Anaerolineae bacterium]|nr:ABC transporter permease [Anaerolineae bacterium]
MRDLFRAEWLKIAGNRWVAGCLVWIFPLGAVLFVIVAALILALSGSARDGFREDGPVLWTDQAVGVWNFPSNPVGRLVLLGFTAVVFAGEYQWQTWKSIVPRNRRAALIVVKFVALGAFVVVAFVLMSILWTLGWGMLSEIAGASYGPKLTGDVLAEFGEDYALQASLTFTATIIAAGYAALAGMVTRSILGGVLAGFVLTFVESGLIFGLMLVGWLLDIPRIVHVYRFTPGYNLLNVTSWINDNVPLNMEPSEEGVFAGIIFSDSLVFSLVVLAAWVLGLIALTSGLFQRQDITS